MDTPGIMATSRNKLDAAMMKNVKTALSQARNARPRPSRAAPAAYGPRARRGSPPLRASHVATCPARGRRATSSSRSSTARRRWSSRGPRTGWRASGPPPGAARSYASS